jgi:hypothetical protein
MTILGKGVRGKVSGSEAFFEHLRLSSVESTSEANAPETRAT